MLARTSPCLAATLPLVGQLLYIVVTLFPPAGTRMTIRPSSRHRLSVLPGER
jgi:hypothetical protein